MSSSSRPIRKSAARLAKNRAPAPPIPAEPSPTQAAAGDAAPPATATQKSKFPPLEPVRGTTPDQMKNHRDDKGPFGILLPSPLSTRLKSPGDFVSAMYKVRPADTEKGTFTLEQLYEVLQCRTIEVMEGHTHEVITIFDEEGSHRPPNVLLSSFGFPNPIGGPAIIAPSSMLD